MKLIFIILLFSLPTYASVPQGIDWHNGTIEEAFELAQKNQKPLFLYWGAIWCPPCNQMKRTIFNSSAFKEEIKNFIPIYLDGDKKRAQYYGEKFQAKGYPTMIVFNSLGKEILRLPTGLNSKQFSKLLKNARSQIKDIQSLIQDAINDKQVNKSEWDILGNYSWTQSEFTDEMALKKTLKSLAFKAPRGSVARDKLFFAYMFKSLNDKEINRKVFGNLIFKTLRDKTKREYFKEEFIYGAREIVDKVFKKYRDKKNFKVELLHFLTQIENDSFEDIKMKFITLIPRIDLYDLTTTKAKFKPAFVEMVKERVALVNKIATNENDRQAIMGSAIYLLRKVGLLELARDYGLKEVEKSLAPHYFMSGLATTFEELGQKEESLKWKKKAWMEAAGHATRVQWGSYYLQALLKDYPGEGKKIISSLKILLSEGFQSNDLFNGRSFQSLKNLKEKLDQWNPDQKTRNQYKLLMAKYHHNCAKFQKPKVCLTWSSLVKH